MTLKHPRLRRILKWAAFALLVLVVLGAGALWFLLATQPGARWLFARLGTLMPGSFEVQELSGPISGPLHIQGLLYKRPGLEIRIDRLDLEWRLRELTDRRLDIRRLAARGIHVLSTPSSSASPTTLPDLNLHFNIIVHDAEVEGLTLGAPGDAAPMVIDSIRLATTDIHNTVRIERLAVRSALFNADVRGTVQPVGDYPVNLALQWSAQPAGMAPLAGGGRLAGTLKRLRIAHGLTRPFPVFVNGILTDPMNSPGFDGRIDFAGVNPHVLMASLPDLPATGQIAFKGRLDAFRSTGTVRAQTAPAGLVALRYRLTRQNARWQLERAEIAFPGTPASLVASARIELGNNPGSRGTAPPTFADQPLTADLDAQWRSLTWPPRGTASFVSAGGKLHLEAQGSVNRFASSGTVAAALPSVGPLEARYRLVRTADTWDVQALNLVVPGSTTQVHLEGKATLAGKAPTLDVHASWRGASWPLTGPPTLISPQGDAQVHGRLDGYQAILRADLAGPPGGSVPPGRWSLSGNGDTQHLHLDRLVGAVLNGQLSGTGEIGWSPGLRWDLRLQGQGLDPTALRADWPGKLTFSATSQGAMAPDGPQGDLVLTQLGGTLRQQPIRANAAVSFRSSNLAISRLDLTWSAAHLKAQGQLGDRLDLGWSLNTPNLSLLVPELSGSASGEGHLGGTRAAPHIQARVQAQGLRNGAQSVAGATASADLDLSNTGPVQLSADLHGLSAAGQTVGALTVRLSGTAAAHTLRLNASDLGDQPDTKIALGASGSLSAGLNPQSTWRGSLQTLDASSKPIGSWSLEHPVALTASARLLDVHDFCWHSGGGKVCATASWSAAGPWSFNAALTALPLALAKPFLPSDLGVSGNIDGRVAANGNAQGLSGAQLDLTPGPGALRFPGTEGNAQEVAFDAGSVHAQAGPHGGTLSARLAFRGVGTTEAQVVMPRITEPLPFAQQPLSGHLEMHWTTLTLLTGLVPDIQHPEGALNASLELSGTGAKPSLRGHATLAGGRVRLPRFGLDIRDVQLDAAGDGSGALTLSGSARSGQGTITLRGNAGLSPSTSAPMHVTLSGNHFQVMNTTDIAMEVSPQLELTYQGSTARLEGKVLVPFGRLQVSQRDKAGPIEPSKDVVFVSSHPQPQPAAATPLSITAHVRLVIPENSFDLNAYGLAGRPYGEVMAVDRPGKPTTGVGQFQIDQGTFQAYGANLTLDHAHLIFNNGPIDDPALDIRASRKSDDQTVSAGVNVAGTASAPKVTVWSSPEMDTSDALAYVVLGHPLGQANSAEGNMVANAATSLGIKGGNLIAAKIGARFGLQQLSLESTGGLSQTSLMLGKYLSPRIYVMYGVGLFQPINTFRVRYILNKRFTLQAESAAGATGGDILYTIEH